jgi:hypothetical protein
VDELIYYANSGEPKDRSLHGIHSVENDTELRRRALTLWYRLRQMQVEQGYEATAAIWINSTRFQPLKQEIEDFEQSLKQLRVVAVGEDTSPRPSAPTPAAIVVDDFDSLDF